VDLAAADLIVGTSAGSCVGAAVATDALAPAVALQRQAETSETDGSIAAHSRPPQAPSKAPPSQAASVRARRMGLVQRP